jgi:hypothetical protein
MNQIELKLQHLQSINGWINHSDTKAFALLGTQGIFFAFIITAVFSREFYELNSSCSLLILAIAIGLNGASVACSFLAVNPRLKLTGGVSPFFFGSVAEKFSNSKEFSEFCSDRLITEKDVVFELEGQIYVNSTIAWRKFKNVAWALRCLVASFIAWVIFVTIIVITAA